MSINIDTTFRAVGLPGWVGPGVRHYLAHTETGQTIRALARKSGCHASTVMRQIRRIETRRDDPLVDAALRDLGAATRDALDQSKDTKAMTPAHKEALPDQDTLNREAMRILRRLCETGAVLAVAAEMEKAVVVRDTAGGGSTRTAVVERAVAQAMALNEWIAAEQTGRITRYHITPTGRAALEEMLAELKPVDRVDGFAEAQQSFAGPGTEWEDHDPRNDADDRPRRMRYALTESPLAALSRRRDKTGTPFLEDALVHAGERLREDFELAQMGTQVTQNWDRFLTPGSRTTGQSRTKSSGASDAQARVAAALAELGPGLSDVVLRCCCYLEGLETAEKRLGWSARSGKIVLRIALMRLKRHYDTTIGPGGPMIG